MMFSAGSFVVRGAACLFSDSLEREFARYGLVRERVWVGLLQIESALGLLLRLEERATF